MLGVRGRATVMRTGRESQARRTGLPAGQAVVGRHVRAHRRRHARPERARHVHATHVRTHGVSTPVARTAALNEAPRAQGTPGTWSVVQQLGRRIFFGEPPWIWKAPLKGTVTAAVTGEPLAGCACGHQTNTKPTQR